MATTPNRQNRYPVGADAADVPLWMQRLAEDLDQHTQIRDGLATSKPSVGTVGGKFGDFWRSTDTNIIELSTGAGWERITHRFVEITHNFLVAGEIRVPAGNVDVIPPMTFFVETGKSVTITRIRDVILAGTSVTYKLQKNGVDVHTGEAVSTTITTTDNADITLADGDRIQLIVTAVSPSPNQPHNLTVALCTEYTV